MGTFKKLQEEVGTVAAMELNLVTKHFNVNRAAFDAVRTAQGKLTFQQEMDDGIALVVQMVEEGLLPREEYLDVLEAARLKEK